MDCEDLLLTDKKCTPARPRHTRIFQLSFFQGIFPPHPTDGDGEARGLLRMRSPFRQVSVDGLAVQMASTRPTYHQNGPTTVRLPLGRWPVLTGASPLPRSRRRAGCDSSSHSPSLHSHLPGDREALSREDTVSCLDSRPKEPKPRDARGRQVGGTRPGRAAAIWVWKQDTVWPWQASQVTADFLPPLRSSESMKPRKSRDQHRFQSRKN